MESGEWRAKSGERRVESEEWRAESGTQSVQDRDMGSIWKARAIELKGTYTSRHIVEYHLIVAELCCTY